MSSKENKKFRTLQMSERFERGLLFGGDFSEQWQHLPRVSLCCGYQTSPSSAWNASLLWGSGCDLTTASVITSVTAKSLLRKSGLSDQHWSKHNGEVLVVVVAVQGGGGAVVCDFAQGSDGFNTFNRTQKLSSTTSAKRARGAQRMARQLWGDTHSPRRHESWQSLVQAVTSTQATEYASLQSC